ncbi:MAG: AAA family ATPase [Pseudodesulfovibrio sp.]|uniref:AAA family ATPase n=1 Tax=Pseudodesulfovibrio sp. TaxID=2035812 RepID=UPI003D1490B3
MKIVQLSAENVKRLEAVEITPEGNTVIIGGDNAQGKSSVLDSILMALAGKRAQGLRPVRDGQDKATITVNLEEFIVTRTITKEGGGTIKVKTKDGASYGSPQKMLDDLTSKLTFDPLAFTNERPAQQVELLKGLVGLDFTEQDAKRSRLYDERRDANRDAANFEGRLKAFGDLEDAPDSPMAIGDILAEAEEIRKHNDEGAERINEMNQLGIEIQDLEDRIQNRQKKLDALKEEHGDWKAKDQGNVRTRIAQAEEKNRKFEDKQRRDEIEENMLVSQAKAGELTKQISAIDEAKRAAMTAADFPVPGLAFDDTGVTFNGIPFEQCSSAEQLRISVAMGIALNPKLKVLLIRDGSLLDSKSLAMVAEAAQEADAQVWIERVSKGSECSVIIEDGKIATTAAEAAA